MSKVVYLMGAGASYGKREKDSNDKDIAGKILEGLPIVNEIPLRLQQIVELYSEPSYTEDDAVSISDIPVNLKNAQATLVNDLHWLYDNTKRHATIDTFAKKLFLTGKKDDYTKLKRLLSIYFKTEQLINRPDSRYDTFLASVLQRNTNGKNASNIKESVLNIIHRAGGIVDENSIILKKDVDQFFLPPEL